MRLPKGKTNNKKGRPKGALNKVSGPLKEQIADFLQEKMGELKKIWPQLSARDKAGLLTDLLPFVVPKLGAVNVEADINFSTLPEEQLDEIAFKLYNYGKGEK